MNILIIGTGHVGKALAHQLRANGHTVVGTTTTPAKVAELEPLLDQVHVLRGNEADKVAAAAQDCDAVIVTVAPNWKTTSTPEQREQQYKEVLVDSCENASAACPRVIFCSSFSVYGDGGDGDAPIDELSPTGNHEEPSSRYYQAAEEAALAGGNGCVLRFPDMYGAPGDMSYPDRVKASHEYFGGKTVFSAEAPLYAIHVDDVVNAIYHVIDMGLQGTFNVCDEERLPYSNKLVFDAICAEEGLAPLEFLNQVKAPLRKISARKLYDTGYCVSHADPNASVVERRHG
ncbi:MAG: NAD-dependent epimerase/dehydratase family protein [Halieaceae bacterium]